MLNDTLHYDSKVIDGKRYLKLHSIDLPVYDKLSDTFGKDYTDIIISDVKRIFKYEVVAGEWISMSAFARYYLALYHPILTSTMSGIDHSKIVRFISNLNSYWNFTKHYVFNDTKVDMLEKLWRGESIVHLAFKDNFSHGINALFNRSLRKMHDRTPKLPIGYSDEWIREKICLDSSIEKTKQNDTEYLNQWEPKKK